jgi:hypothetical protein
MDFCCSRPVSVFKWSPGQLNCAQANTAVGVSPETFLLQLLQEVRSAIAAR